MSEIACWVRIIQGAKPSRASGAQKGSAVIGVQVCRSAVERL
jgi:hypothetical protein